MSYKYRKVIKLYGSEHYYFVKKMYGQLWVTWGALVDAVVFKNQEDLLEVVENTGRYRQALIEMELGKSIQIVDLGFVPGV